MKFNSLLLILFHIMIKSEVVNSWTANPLCWFGECCDSNDIPADFYKLNTKLTNYVYGQPLTEIIVNAIASHWNPYRKPNKTLTLSFHGGPGSGKSYVSNFIAESLYKEGIRSKFVHYFIGRIHFPLEEHVLQYNENLYKWLKGNITECPRQIFIFDEVNVMPPGVLNAIKPFIDNRKVVDGNDYTQTIFIFLSSTGTKLINKQYEDYWRARKRRENLSLRDFENLIMNGAFVEKGGFYHADAIKENLIDHYVPFLPMEINHVRECIKNEFKQRRVEYPEETHIKEVLDLVEWAPEDLKIFSKSGCKRLGPKISVVVEKYYSSMKDEF